MNYTDSVSDFFRNPNWLMNMLLGGLCVLIPVIGPMVLLGWLVTGFWSRQDQSFQTFPAFDFSHFGNYLERGLWPFLVTLVVSLCFSIVFVPLIWIFLIPMMVIGGLSSHGHESVGGCFAALAVIVVMLIAAVSLVALFFILIPLKIRAALTQDFVKSFDFHFVKRFIALTWVEILISALFIFFVGTLLACLGAIIFCVGTIFANVLTYFALVHLYKQLYALYLSRGGEPVPVSPKLSDPLPAA